MCVGRSVKLAISLPEDLYAAAERERRARQETRSEFFRRALAAFLRALPFFDYEKTVWNDLKFLSAYVWFDMAEGPNDAAPAHGAPNRPDPKRSATATQIERDLPPAFTDKPSRFDVCIVLRRR